MAGTFSAEFRGLLDYRPGNFQQRRFSEGVKIMESFARELIKLEKADHGTDFQDAPGALAGEIQPEKSGCRKILE